MILGGTPGDYHVIRNGGGLVTDDAIRSLMVSQYHGTDRIVVMMHTDCGAMTVFTAGSGTTARRATAKTASFSVISAPVST